ncbi:MAG: 50S ribosomal protein L10 [Candidatus Magasanikbacteria bacterium]
MAKTRLVKEQAIEDLVNDLKNSSSAVFANYQGLKVSDSEILRNKCREQNISVTASKKTLLKRALKEMNLDVDTKQFEGSVAVFLGKEDEVAPAQIVAEFAKKHERVTLFGGILEGNFISGEKVKELSKLPNKQQLLGQLVGTLNAPISGFVNVLAGNLRGLVNVMNAIKESKS